ncbi:hypothetical protein U1Q18_032925 [Sarracenia purpurea var. burkii]
MVRLEKKSHPGIGPGLGRNKLVGDRGWECKTGPGPAAVSESFRDEVANRGEPDLRTTRREPNANQRRGRKQRRRESATREDESRTATTRVGDQRRRVSSCHTPHIEQKQGDLPGISGDVRQVGSVKGNSYCSNADDVLFSESLNRVDETATSSSANAAETNGSMCINSIDSVDESRIGNDVSSSGSPWFQLRKDATVFVSQTLQRGRKNLWQLTASRVSVLLSSDAVSSTSIHQFLRNYEDLNVFILAGEAFCSSEVVEFRQKVKAVCENYFVAFHRQNIYALKMVLEKENWLKYPPETIEEVSFSGLVGDGAALIVPSDHNSSNKKVAHSNKSADLAETGYKKGGFSYWLKSGNPFLVKLGSKEYQDTFSLNGSDFKEPGGKTNENYHNDMVPPNNNHAIDVNGHNSVSEDENEDLHADFIDEDSQLPSRISKSKHSRNYSSHCNDEEMIAQTGSSLCLLRLMDKYARLMQKLEIVNVEFFKGICQLFGIFFYFVFETFGQQNTHPSGKGLTDSLSYRLKTTLSRITQDCDQWIKPHFLSFSASSPTSMNTSPSHMDVTPTSPRSTNLSYQPTTVFGLKV